MARRDKIFDRQLLELWDGDAPSKPLSEPRAEEVDCSIVAAARAHALAKARKGRRASDRPSRPNGYTRAGEVGRDRLPGISTRLFMAPHDFIKRCRELELKERPASQSHEWGRKAIKLPTWCLLSPEGR